MPLFCAVCVLECVFPVKAAWILHVVKNLHLTCVRVSGLCRRGDGRPTVLRQTDTIQWKSASNEKPMSRFMIIKIYRIWKEKVKNSGGHIVFPIRLSLFHVSHAP